MEAGMARGGYQTGPMVLAAIVGLSVWFVLRTSRHMRGGNLAGRSAAPSSSPKAKSGVPSAPVELDEEMQQLQLTYEKMAATFAASGLDVAAIADAGKFFDGTDDASALPWPKRYAAVFPDLPPGSTRIIALPLEDSPKVASLAALVGSRVMALLPPSFKVFANARQNYHITVFHTSKFSDARPNARAADGGVDLSQPSAQRGQISQAELQREVSELREVFAGSAAPLLQLDRVAMTRGGVLLVTWVDVGGSMVPLRRRLRESFPGACSSQASTIHTTLFRVLTPQQLDAASIEAIQKECELLTGRFRGSQLRPVSAWYVNEVEFSTINGDRERLPFKAASE